MREGGWVRQVATLSRPFGNCMALIAKILNFEESKGASVQGGGWESDEKYNFINYSQTPLKLFLRKDSRRQRRGRWGPISWVNYLCLLSFWVLTPLCCSVIGERVPTHTHPHSRGSWKVIQVQINLVHFLSTVDRKQFQSFMFVRLPQGGAVQCCGTCYRVSSLGRPKEARNHYVNK